MLQAEAQLQPATSKKEIPKTIVEDS